MERPCRIQGCEREYVAIGLCGTHYAQYRRGKLPDYEPPPHKYVYRTRRAATGPCEYEHCGRPARNLGLCEAHAEQRARGLELHRIRERDARRVCRLDGCERRHEAHGLCNTHYNHAVGRAEIATSGTGTRKPTISSGGYRLLFIPGHPRAQKTGYVAEHIVVMTALVGRDLLPEENIHHKNGVRLDNRPENLELWLTKQPKGQRVSDAVVWAKEILARYEPEALA